MPETITVSWSEISTARDCPNKHRLGYKERWRKDSTSPALSRGILGHLVMEHHYEGLRSGDFAKAKEAITYLLNIGGLDQTEEQALVQWCYEGYLEHYADVDVEWEILAIEHPFEVWLPTDRGGRSRFRIKGKIDLVIRIGGPRGRIWIVDHKFLRDLPRDKTLELDDQFGLYVWAMQQLGKKVHGCLYNTIRTHRNVSKAQPLEERFSRHLMYRTPTELQTIATEAYFTVKRAWGPEPGGRTPNTQECGWKCDFTEVCLASRKGVDERQMLNAKGYQQEMERHH